MTRSFLERVHSVMHVHCVMSVPDSHKLHDILHALSAFDTLPLVCT